MRIQCQIDVVTLKNPRHSIPSRYAKLWAVALAMPNDLIRSGTVQAQPGRGWRSLSRWSFLECQIVKPEENEKVKNGKENAGVSPPNDYVMT